jgi:hypothetical protein
MGKEIVNEPPPMDITTIALAMAVCDLLVTERAKLKAVIELLERKGLLSTSEVSEAMQSIASLPPESAGADWQRLQQRLQERMAIRFQELVLHSGKIGPTQ